MFDNEVDFFLANIKIFIGRPRRKIHLSPVGHGRAAVGPSGRRAVGQPAVAAAAGPENNELNKEMRSDLKGKKKFAELNSTQREKLE